MGRRRNGSGTLYRRGKVYYAQLSVNGKVLRLSTGLADKRQALARLNSLARGYDLPPNERLAAVQAALAAPAGGGIAFEDAWAAYERTPRYRQSVRRLRYFSWQRFLSWRKLSAPTTDALEDITDERAAECLQYLLSLYAPRTVANTISQLSQIWQALRQPRNPWQGLPRVQGQSIPRRALTAAQIAQALAAAKGEMRLLLTIGAYTGLRVSDAATLRWEDISADRQIINLRPRKTAHTSGVAVAIPIHPALRDALGPHKGTGFVLPTQARRKPAGICESVRKFFGRLGFVTGERPAGYRYKVSRLNFHSFRVAFITTLANAGTPLGQIQALVGHATPTMTLHYYRTTAERARAAVEKLPEYAAK